MIATDYRNLLANTDYDEDRATAGICFIPTAKFDLTHPILRSRRLSSMADDTLTMELEPASNLAAAHARCAAAASSLVESGLYPSTKVVSLDHDPSRYCLVDRKSRVVVEFSVVVLDYRNETIH